MPDRPLIGISTCLDAGRIHRAGQDYLYLSASYSTAVRTAGGLPVLVPVPADPEVVERLDGLVLTGGVDVHPHHYGQEIRAEITLEDERRVASDLGLLQASLALGRPLLAVCYGMQLLNVHLGGTLVQALPTVPLDHGCPGNAREHQVRLASETWLAEVCGSESITVASAHRQAVGEVADGLEAVAWAPDGVVEAVARGGDVLGVQWHPEQSPAGVWVYEWLVDRCVATSR